MSDKTNKKEVSNTSKTKKTSKKRLGIALGISIPLVVAGATVGIVFGVKGCNTSNIEMGPNVPSDISIKSENIQKGKESTFELNIPTGKSIDDIELTVGNLTLTKADGIKIEGNKITIPADKMVDSKVIIKSITLVTEEEVKITVVGATYDKAKTKVALNTKSTIVLVPETGKQITKAPKVVKIGGQVFTHYTFNKTTLSIIIDAQYMTSVNIYIEVESEPIEMTKAQWIVAYKPFSDAFVASTTEYTKDDIKITGTYYGAENPSVTTINYGTNPVKTAEIYINSSEDFELIAGGEFNINYISQFLDQAEQVYDIKYSADATSATLKLFTKGTETLVQEYVFNEKGYLTKMVQVGSTKAESIDITLSYTEPATSITKAEFIKQYTEYFNTFQSNTKIYSLNWIKNAKEGGRTVSVNQIATNWVSDDQGNKYQKFLGTADIQCSDYGLGGLMTPKMIEQALPKEDDKNIYEYDSDTGILTYTQLDASNAIKNKLQFNKFGLFTILKDSTKDIEVEYNSDATFLDARLAPKLSSTSTETIRIQEYSFNVNKNDKIQPSITLIDTTSPTINSVKLNDTTLVKDTDYEIKQISSSGTTNITFKNFIDLKTTDQIEIDATTEVVEKISVDPTSVSVLKGGQFDITATLTGVTGDINWTSTGEQTVTFSKTTSSSGEQVTVNVGSTKGKAEATATWTSGEKILTATCDITITDQTPVGTGGTIAFDCSPLNGTGILCRGPSIYNSLTSQFDMKLYNATGGPDITGYAFITYVKSNGETIVIESDDEITLYQPTGDPGYDWVSITFSFSKIFDDLKDGQIGTVKLSFGQKKEIDTFNTTELDSNFKVSKTNNVSTTDPILELAYSYKDEDPISGYIVIEESATNKIYSPVRHFEGAESETLKLDLSDLIAKSNSTSVKIKWQTETSAGNDLKIDNTSFTACGLNNPELSGESIDPDTPYVDISFDELTEEKNISIVLKTADETTVYKEDNVVLASSQSTWQLDVKDFRDIPSGEELTIYCYPYKKVLLNWDTSSFGSISKDFELYNTSDNVIIWNNGKDYNLTIRYYYEGGASGKLIFEDEDGNSFEFDLTIDGSGEQTIVIPAAQLEDLVNGETLNVYWSNQQTY